MAMYYKKIKLMLLNATKLFVFLGSISSICFSQDSFEQIENDLRTKQAEAIENVKKHFVLVPNSAWQKADQLINLVRQETRNHFLEEPNKAYYFQPPLFQKPFKNHNELFSFLDWNKKDISISTLSSYLSESLLARGIKKESIHCAVPSNDLIELTAAGHTNDLTTCLGFVKDSTVILDKTDELSVRFNPYIYCNIEKIKEIHNIFSIIPNFIHHELTHILEAHSTIIDILANTIKTYYPQTDVYNTSCIINLITVHELIADVVSAIVCPSVAFLYGNQALLSKLYIISNQIGPYPTFSELKQWAKRIITCYEASYGKISLYNRIAFTVQTPAIRTLLLAALSMSICFSLAKYY